ncbi:acyl-CoA synthetase [Mycobacterium leprae Kyoto-2]|uniref:Acyl-CoA synthetase n=3 Tax=Mycobacterium leprae TaxID=1769 RepID=Q9CD79_MYCLE|nr:fatty-acid--AMP ligase FAAL28/FadD28 [Mycobacterium leprae]CAR70231.1 acyl-CoA synthetase [Mycobacterium leprae Br4923]AWV47130.1 acyl-CoA synthetase [Mycobacterium leprae]OAR20695.1 acyl-CoA synthetase [Mycobacterium leprae 3125609]OAX70442.1 acyl-CoA synthetase [Mycobacterium leprae 7935681]CAC29646.1 acyl-CoA synthetase [Mycobacterium leprae]
MSVRSIPAVLRTCARLQPNDPVFTFMDYEQDWDGVKITLTWSQLYRRTLNVAQELNRCGSTGDRVAISAPQGLDYVVAFLGALQAGRIAVPLSVPQGGVTDERFESVLNDSSPVAILTTSPAVDDVVHHVTQRPDESTPSIIEVDLLDLDSPNGSGDGNGDHLSTAYLQYTSGSTRTPAGVMISHHNLRANFEQLMSTYLADTDGVFPVGGMSVSWLPFYHDMGLILGVCVPILGGCPAVLTSPVSFLQRPARWMHMLASEFPVFSAAPNFAFELATKKISDDDMIGVDLGNIHIILNGSERVQPATIKRFNNRFARFNLKEKAVRPSYGLAEATVYVATSRSGQPAELVDFDAESLSTGQAKTCTSGNGTSLISYVLPPSPIVRIVDSDTCIQCQDGTVGEIWVHGDNVADGYWQKPDESERTFGGKIAAPSRGTPEGPWLRTGDSGFVIDGKMFIIGRIKDLLIVYGRNHSPDDIEGTIQEITRGRCAAISVPDRNTEKLVAIIELKKLGDADQYAMDRLGAIKREVISALSNSHGLSVSDVVLVAPGSIPITTSGKVRRSTCVERYRQDQFDRLDA